MNIVPIPFRWIALAVLIAASMALGWTLGARHVQAAFDKDVAARDGAATVQVVRSAKIEVAQEKVSKEAADHVQADLDAVRRSYADRLRSQPQIRCSAVPGASESAGDPTPAAEDAGSAAGAGLRVESYGELAARCAETTVIARGWQRWWDGVEQVGRQE